jgi:hypothetical protein
VFSTTLSQNAAVLKGTDKVSIIFSEEGDNFRFIRNSDDVDNSNNNDDDDDDNNNNNNNNNSNVDIYTYNTVSACVCFRKFNEKLFKNFGNLLCSQNRANYVAENYDVVCA